MLSNEKIYYTIPEELEKLFWTRLKEEAYAILGKGLEQL